MKATPDPVKELSQPARHRPPSIGVTLVLNPPARTMNITNYKGTHIVNRQGSVTHTIQALLFVGVRPSPLNGLFRSERLDVIRAKEPSKVGCSCEEEKQLEAG